MSGIYLVLFVLIMPITVWAVGQQLNLFPKAAPLSLPITNPITLPYNSPTPTPKPDAFSVILSNPQTTIYCPINDTNCAYRGSLTATNWLNYNIYTTIIGTSDGNTRYIDFNGNWTSATSTSNKTILPGEVAINTNLEVKPFYQTLGTPGKQTHAYLIDAKVCYTPQYPTSCGHYGVISIPIVINIFSIPTPTFTPTPTLKITPTFTPTPTIIRQKKHSISGKVTYQIGRIEIPAPNVEIAIRNTSSKNIQTVRTNFLGNYQASVLQTGTYQVTPKSGKNTVFNPTSRLVRVADFDAAGVNFKGVIKKIIGIF